MYFYGKGKNEKGFQKSPEKPGKMSLMYSMINVFLSYPPTKFCAHFHALDAMVPTWSHWAEFSFLFHSQRWQFFTQCDGIGSFCIFLCIKVVRNFTTYYKKSTLFSMYFAFIFIHLRLKNYIFCRKWTKMKTTNHVSIVGQAYLIMTMI